MMSDEIAYRKLFSNSSFFIMRKSDYEKSEVQEIVAKMNILYDLGKFHPERRKEYLLGRYCAHQAHLKLIGTELLSLSSNPDRSPKWPDYLVGSISHNHDYVCCAMAPKKHLRGLGVDIEELGRTKIELAKHITIEDDLSNHSSFSDKELLTFIFSAKESLYKALYPEVKIFFGFDSAYVSEIDTIDQTFKIHLAKSLNDQFSPEKQSLFEGRFLIQDNSLLTIVEIN